MPKTIEKATLARLSPHILHSYLLLTNWLPTSQREDGLQYYAFNRQPWGFSDATVFLRPHEPDVRTHQRHAMYILRVLTQTYGTPTFDMSLQAAAEYILSWV